MRRLLRWLILMALLSAGCAPGARRIAARSETAHAKLPGRQADGSILLPNQWSLRPAGKQVELGDFPINMAVHPRGRFAAILENGYSAHEIVVVDISTAMVVSRSEVHEAFYGLEFSSDGK